MNSSEKTARPIKVFESTYATMEKFRGKRSFSVFVDDAVNFYVKSLDEGDPYTRIVKAIELINERQSTNLGLLCEVLRQAGILNGNGEVEFKKSE